MAVSASIPSAKLTTLLKGKPKISSLVEMVAIDPQSIMKKLGSIYFVVKKKDLNLASFFSVLV